MLCAAPLYLPVQCQWSLTFSGFSSLRCLSSKFYEQIIQFISLRYALCFSIFNGIFFVFSKLVTFIVCFLKDLQNFFHAVFTSWCLHHNCFTIHKMPIFMNWILQRRCSTNFAVGDFSGLFLYLFTFLIKDSRSS